jgi:predicted transcriptional regulator
MTSNTDNTNIKSDEDNLVRISNYGSLLTKDEEQHITDFINSISKDLSKDEIASIVYKLANIDEQSNVVKTIMNKVKGGV